MRAALTPPPCAITSSARTGGIGRRKEPVMVAIPLSTPRTDETARLAIARADRVSDGRLYVSIADRCGDQLIEAFRRMAAAYYGRQS
jgi:hypothetical protein